MNGPLCRLEHVETHLSDLRRKLYQTMKDLDRARHEEGEALDKLALVKDELARAMEVIEQLKTQLRTKDEMIDELQTMLGRTSR